MPFYISCPYRAEVADTAVCTPDCTRCQNRENTHTDTKTHRQNKYCNPRACAPRVNYIDYSVFRLHIYVISKWVVNTTFTHTLTAIARVSPYMHSTCTSYVLNAYLYCVYALVGWAISIRDPYICAVSRVCTKNRTLSSTGPLSVQ